MATTDKKLHHLTIHEAGELLKSGELSPVELTQAFFDRIADTDDRLHSFITLLHENAMGEARAAEAEIRSGRYRGPLHGIPIALKDLYDTAGIRTTAGSRVDFDRVPTADSTPTARLKEAGSILLGKLAMHEFALGGPDWSTPFAPTGTERFQIAPSSTAKDTATSRPVSESLPLFRPGSGRPLRPARLPSGRRDLADQRPRRYTTCSFEQVGVGVGPA